MKLERQWLQILIFGGGESSDGEPVGMVGIRRFLQDSPILPDVWMRYGDAGSVHASEDLLLTPHLDTGTGPIAAALSRELGAKKRPRAQAAYNQTVVAARLTFEEVWHLVLPRTKWWQHTVDRFLDDIAPDATSYFPIAGRLRQLAAHPEVKVLLPATGPLRAVRDDLHTARASEDADKATEGDEARATARARQLTAHPLSVDLLWMVRTAGVVARGLADRTESGDLEGRKQAWREILETPAATLGFVADWLEKLARTHRGEEDPLIYSVALNRTAFLTVTRSHQTVKADAAIRLFNISCRDLTWAVIDTGIDATHPAFRARDPVTGKPYPDPFEKVTQGGITYWANRTRVKATFDFTRIRELLSVTAAGFNRLPPDIQARLGSVRGARSIASTFRKALLSGRDVDWSAVRTLIEIRHDPDQYRPPKPDLAHGTHVAGILAADWDDNSNPYLAWGDRRPASSRGARESGARVDGHGDGRETSSQSTVRGICPDLNLYDLRVLNGQPTDDEFSIISALQFLRYLNSQRDFMVVQGANISISIRHDVLNYACGRTPICEECERLVASRVVVVAAAGNQGYRPHGATPGSLLDSYQSISITDPGNAQGVITVGATHRTEPHTYGVSFFSSRGPTGDGRGKPDLVAPGEKIQAPIPDVGLLRMDGTSMAAPHVSGGAALLIARYRELLGQPGRIKSILCETATDLGRERYFQGAGMLDILRALQSV